MTLAADLETDLADVFFNLDDFAAVDEYTPSGGVARDVHGIAEELVEARLDDETGDETHEERIKYFVGRDADDYGIDDPQIGDQLVLASDPDSTPYTFSGEIPERDANAWWLVFWRPRRTGRGTRREYLR